MSILRGPADADNFRVKVGRYGDRWYTDALPTDDIATATPDNEVFPSVSTCKKASGNDWSFVALKRVAAAIDTATYNRLDQQPLEHRYEALKTINKLGLNAAGQRGTNVHLMAEAHLYGRLPSVGPNDPGYDYKAAVDQFFDHYQPTLDAAEFVCIHRTLNGAGYGGTSDAILDIDGRKYLVDWKSRGEDSDHGAYPEEAAQIAAYARADYIIVEGDHGPERRRVPKLDGGLIVSIKPDGCRVYPIDLDAAFNHWTALHAWWVARQTERSSVGRQWPARKISAGAPVQTAPLNAGEVEGAAMPPSPASSPAPWEDDETVAEMAQEKADQFQPPARTLLPTDIDQGDDLSGDAYKAQWSVLQRRYGELDDTAKAWLADVISAAMRRNLTFHAKTIRSTRSFELYRGLIHLAAGGDASDDLLRELVALVIGEIALDPTIETGHIVGSLDATNATKFAAAVDHFYDRAA